MAHDRRDEPPGHEFRENSGSDADASNLARDAAGEKPSGQRLLGENEDAEGTSMSLSCSSPFDELPDDFPDSAGIDLDPDFSSLDSSAELDHDPASGEERPEDDLGSEFSEFADIDNPEMAADLIGETSQDEDPGRWSAHEHGQDDAENVADRSAMPTVAKVGGKAVGRDHAPPVTGLRPRGRRTRTSAGSLLGVVIGGLLSLPVVAAILLWGFRRDDFGIARSLPEPLAFLVPSELRSPRWPRTPVPMPPPPLIEPPPEQVVADPVLAAAERAALTMASARAEVMLDAVLDVPEDAPPVILAPALIDWYKSLATMAEEAAVLEGDLTAAGRDVDTLRPSWTPVASRIAASPRATQELVRLTWQWIASNRRSSDGIVLFGRLQATRQAGSAWVSTVLLDGEQPFDSEDQRESSADDVRSRDVTVLSRRELRVADGEQMVVLGVIVSGDVVWAADAMPVDELGSP